MLEANKTEPERKSNSQVCTSNIYNWIVRELDNDNLLGTYWQEFRSKRLTRKRIPKVKYHPCGSKFLSCFYSCFISLNITAGSLGILVLVDQVPESL